MLIERTDRERELLGGLGNALVDRANKKVELASTQFEEPRNQMVIQDAASMMEYLKMTQQELSLYLSAGLDIVGLCIICGTKYLAKKLEIAVGNKLL